MSLTMSLESELKLLIHQLFILLDKEDKKTFPKVVSLITQLISLVKSMDLESQPKPESEFISLVKQVISLWSAISNSDPESEFISHVNSLIGCINSSSEVRPELVAKLSDVFQSLASELQLLIAQVVQLAMFGSYRSLISISPQLEVECLKDRKIGMRRKVQRRKEEKRDCYPPRLKLLSLTGEAPTHFHCEDCNGEDHEESDKAPLEVKNPLHPKHSLQLVQSSYFSESKECQCCDEDLKGVFYFCTACEFSMNIACVKKPPVLSIDHPKWHRHALALFSRHTSLICDVCALAHSECPFYICPPCGFAVHRKCIDLPRVIKISRHPHRISFTSSFDQKDWSCGVCRRKIDSDYGGFSCFKDRCSYAVHSRCATQSNVWDGIDLDGVPQEIKEVEVEPYVTISPGVIQHFSHQQHHLRLLEDMSRDYDEDKQCQACITPIYFGNFYSCIECNFILHEECAKFSRRIQHPLHPHTLTLTIRYGRTDSIVNCSTCPHLCTVGMYYECHNEECDYIVHLQCGTLSEPLAHESHQHPLFLTSKPGERRRCLVCRSLCSATFNCIEGECGFSLCFGCATLPYQVKYKHDKHMLTLSYGEETSTGIYWCEVCEGEMDAKDRFYKCDEYCCVTLHVKCLIGKDLYMEPGSSILHEVDVLPNNHHMTRPFCSKCKMRCPHKIVFKKSGLIFCSLSCAW